MITKVKGWKLYPGPYRNEELIRYVTSDPTSTELERELALRLDRLLFRCDVAEGNDPTQLQLPF